MDNLKGQPGPECGPGIPLIEIDTNSGFCFGVVTAIEKAEAELERGESLASFITHRKWNGCV